MTSPTNRTGRPWQLTGPPLLVLLSCAADADNTALDEGATMPGSGSPTTTQGPEPASDPALPSVPAAVGGVPALTPTAPAGPDAVPGPAPTTAPSSETQPQETQPPETQPPETVGPQSFQAAGPDGNFVFSGSAPTKFSVSLGENVRYRKPLPNTGQGAVAVAANKAFVLSHSPITQDETHGSLTVGQAFDLETGEELWRRDVPGGRVTALSSLFSDNTAASPVVTDSHVAFVNVGGSIAVYDHAGNEAWTNEWEMLERHHTRQHQPLLVDDQLIVFRVGRHAGANNNWTYLHSYQMGTGELNWIAEAGTGVHTTSTLTKNEDGTPLVLTGRGGSHAPLEKPYGISLLSALDGKTVWDFSGDNFWGHQNIVSDADGVYAVTDGTHLWLDRTTGAQIKQQSLQQGVRITDWTGDGYRTRDNQTFNVHQRLLTYNTNIIVEGYHYYRSYTRGFLARVHLETGSTEYLQVPLQVVRAEGEAERVLWDQTLPNELRNADGFIASNGGRNGGNGWSHVPGPQPIAVGSTIYFPTMVGTVYVIDGAAETFDENAILSISDLGPAQETWTLSSMSYAEGRLYARTLKELICIGE